MEKQTGRKIKVLQFNNVSEYKRDQFLRFGQNNGIDMHFTVRKQIGVPQELNCVLMEKVWSQLSNAQLDKLFQHEVLIYASHLIDRLSSTTIEGKTLLNIQSGGAAQDCDLLWVFGCPTYFIVKNDKLNS